jgi:nitrous oxidase accessory protein NosD
VIDLNGARNAAVVGNRLIGNVPGGIVASASVNTTVAKNHVVGSPKTDAEGIFVEVSSRTTVVNNVVSNYPEGHNVIEVDKGIDTTIAGNDLIGNCVGVFVIDSSATKILSNDMSRSGIVGIFMAGPKPANVKVVGNNISGGAFGTFITDTHHGSFAGNTIHDNCAGMFFEADGFKEPVSGFEVKGNTVENNAQSCRAAQFDRNFSGIGIALLGASGMELTGNKISGSVSGVGQRPADAYRHGDGVSGVLIDRGQDAAKLTPTGVSHQCS